MVDVTVANYPKVRKQLVKRLRKTAWANVSHGQPKEQKSQEPLSSWLF